ncbi:hypothetical protein [Nonomuraea sp. NPDC049646]|uniref:hypothetical protein n=1 Tax=unclassified Nonomuraea TaxID=2593643 RepID=UPI0037AE0803
MDYTLPTGLAAWLHRHDAHVQAAVQLLVDHGHWLNDPTFVAVAIQHSTTGLLSYIDWDRVQQAIDDRAFPATTSELAILRLAVMLGRDDLNLCTLDQRHREQVLQAMTYALTRRPS